MHCWLNFLPEFYALLVFLWLPFFSAFPFCNRLLCFYLFAFLVNFCSPLVWRIRYASVCDILFFLRLASYVKRSLCVFFLFFSPSFFCYVLFFFLHLLCLRALPARVSPSWRLLSFTASTHRWYGRGRAIEARGPSWKSRIARAETKKVQPTHAGRERLFSHAQA